MQMDTVQMFLLDRKRRTLIRRHERKQFLTLVDNLQKQVVGLGLNGVYKMDFSFLAQVVKTL